MRYNEIETEDDPFQLAGGTEWPGFFDHEAVTKDMIAPTTAFDDKTMTYNRMWMYLSNESLKHSRKTYSLLDLFGDFGGLLEMTKLIFGVFIWPWSSFQFSLKAIQKLYLVNTTQRKLFKKSESEKNKQAKKNLERASQNLGADVA